MSNFYRDRFRRMMSVLVGLLLTALCLVTVYILIGLAQPASRYYASTTTGNIIPIESLSSPVVTMEFIQQWSQTVARGAYSLNFLSYEQQLKNIQPYFTADAWIAFQKGLQDSGLLDQVKKEKLYLSTVVNGPTVILDRYVSSGHYTWDVQLPLLILFSSSSMHAKRQVYISMTIKRVPELEMPQGIAVTKFVMGGGKNE